jgi:hypothetical protein
VGQEEVVEAAEVVEETVVEGAAVVLVEALVGWFAVIVGAAAVGEFAEDASVVAAAATVGYTSMGMKDMASCPEGTFLVCHSHRMEMAEKRHYCTVLAGGFARADTAAAANNEDIGRNQAVGSSSPRETDRTHIICVVGSRARW